MVKEWVPCFRVFKVENKTNLGAKPGFGNIWGLLSYKEMSYRVISDDI